MDPISAAATLGIVAGALVALGVIGKTLLSVYKFVRRIDNANTIISELPEWQAKVNLAMKELHPNSGSSLKDQVTDLHTKVCENNGKVDTLGNSLQQIHDMLQSHVADDQLHSQ